MRLVAGEYGYGDTGFGVFLSLQSVWQVLSGASADAYKRDLDLEGRERTENLGFFVRWKSFKFYDVPPAKRLLLYKPVPVFWIKMGSSLLLPVLSLHCFAY